MANKTGTPITKLRHLTIAVILLTGIALLTASYLTTDKDWAYKLLDTTTQTGQSASKAAQRDINARIKY